MPPHCQTQSWRLASTQHDNPASFLKVPTSPNRTKSTVVTADVIRHTVAPARGPPPTSRIRGRFASHETLPSHSSQSPDRRVSGRLRTAGSLERHQLGQAGSATLPPKNNRESCSRSREEARLKIAANSTALLARKLQRAKGTKAKGLTAC